LKHNIYLNKNTGPDLSKNNNPGLDFLKKIQDPCVHDFFFKLIIWNIDIQSCL
jgi:hypothetical protein